jgi:hypothetical protein
MILVHKNIEENKERLNGKARLVGFKTLTLISTKNRD